MAACQQNNGCVQFWLLDQRQQIWGASQTSPGGNWTSMAGPNWNGTQQLQTYTFSGGAWGGANFALLPGEACEVTIGAPLSWDLVGAESSAPTYGFAVHTDVGNLSWVSLPENATLADARSLVAPMNGGAGAGPVTKVAQLDPATREMQSYLFFAGAWRGTNFALQPGTGVAVLVGGDLPSWSPHLSQP